jgi:hypothetical protein
MRTRTPTSSSAADARTCAATSAGDRPSPRSTVSARPGWSIVRCRSAKGTKTVRASCCPASSANSPASSERISDTDTRSVRARSSRRPKSEDDGIAAGRRTVTSSVEASAAPSSSARARLKSASLPRGPVAVRPCRAQKRSSTPNTRTFDARRPLASSATTPLTAITGADATCAACPSSPARASRKKPPERTTWETPPRRRRARSRRLARTESPTRSAPPRTATAVATPAITAACTRQWCPRPRRTRGGRITGAGAARLRPARGGRGTGGRAPGCG